LPFCTAVLLVYVRSRYPLSRYVVAATPFLVFAVVYAVYRDDVLYGSARGFDSWALLYAFASIAAVCAVRTRAWWARSTQVLASFLFANYWILDRTWVA